MKLTPAKLKKAEGIPDLPVFAVTGSEDLVRREALATLTRHFLDDSFGDFDCDRMEGQAFSAQRALGAWQTMPMGGGKRVVMVSRLEEAPAAEIQVLAKGVVQPSPSGCLILEISGDSSKDIQSLLKAVDKVGAVVQCSAAKADDARQFLSEAAEKAGARLEPAAAEEMIRRLGNDLWQLESEVNKLASYVWPEQTIRRTDIEALIPETPEDRVFAMIDAISDGNAASAHRLMEALFLAADDDRGAAHRTLALLVRHFRLLWQARVLRDAGFSFREGAALPAPAEEMFISAPSIGDVFKRQTFLLRKFASQSQRFSLKRLGRVFEVLADTDLALKGYSASLGDPRSDLSACLTRICLIAAAPSGTRKKPGAPSGSRPFA